MSKQIAITLLLALWCGYALADSRPISASTWLRTSAAPTIAKVLSSHPKFKGQRVSIGMLYLGRPTVGSNRLVDRFATELSHQILQKGHNNVAQQAQGCGLQSQAPWYLAIRITQTGNRHEVAINMLDMQSGDWVSGVSQRWRGRLSTAEKQALKSVSPSTPIGHRTLPFAALDDPRVVSALQTTLRCRALKVPPGTIWTVNDDEFTNLLQITEHSLSRRLPVTFVDEGSNADWRLYARREAVERSLDRVSIELTSTSGLVKPIAELYVLANDKPRTTVAAPLQRNQPLVPAVAIMTEPSLRAERDPSCRRCAAVTLDLPQSAHVLIFSTRQHEVFPLSCDAPVSKRHAGAYQFRIRDVDNTAFRKRPASGIYALIADTPAELAPIADQLLRASKRCGGTDQALPSFMQAVDSMPQTVLWQAIHLRRNGRQITTLEASL